MPTNKEHPQLLEYQTPPRRSRIRIHVAFWLFYGLGCAFGSAAVDWIHQWQTGHGPDVSAGMLEIKGLVLHTVMVIVLYAWWLRRIVRNENVVPVAGFVLGALSVPLQLLAVDFHWLMP
jgi:hypothetical protein